jgi:hypothetical protein
MPAARSSTAVACANLLPWLPARIARQPRAAGKRAMRNRSPPAAIARQSKRQCAGAGSGRRSRKARPAKQRVSAVARGGGGAVPGV